MRRCLLISLLLCIPSAGCATSNRTLSGGRLATSADDLGLRRVVLYRNGVGYFERHGEVEDNVLRLRVRRDQIDDLLKSLTVIDRSSGRAVSVSMPLDPEDWARAAMATVNPDSGSLSEVLSGLRGTAVVLQTTEGRVRGRIVMVEQIVNEPHGDARSVRSEGDDDQPEIDHKVTLLRDDRLEIVRLSKVRGVTLQDGDIALQLHRRLDAAAGEGMFQQVEVAVRLTDAKEHDVLISYVVAAPMWKPTYRVVLPEDGQGEALLQGWAVVDNVSGEDWNDVRLALTSGEPIAFRYDLHTPRDVPRTDLTESGVRKRARVAVGETTFAGDDDGELEEAAPVVEGEIADEEDAFAQDQMRATRKEKAKKSGIGTRSSAATGAGTSRDAAGEMPRSAPSPSQPAPDPEPSVDFDALRRSTQATARAQQVSGMSRFDLQEPVTVPNGSSTMVAIINDTVQAEETFLYRPGGAGVGYDANPYRVVRFKNDTPFVLEPGPISIYSGGSFVGEGLSEAVGTKTSATIPFAVEPSIMVTSTSKRKGDEMRLLRITRGVLEVESFARTETTWTAKRTSKGDAAQVLIRHPKAGWNYEIIDEPKDTEALPDAYLVPLPIAKGRAEGTVTVVEQTPSKTTLSIWDTRAPHLLEEVLMAADITPEIRSKLEPVLKRRQEIGKIDTEIDGLQRQQVELDQRAQQTRQNLEAIKKDAAAGSLRRKLNERLEEFTTEADTLGRRIVELQSQRLEKKIELEDLLQDLDLRPTAKSSAPSQK